MVKKYYCGIDLHSKSMVICILNKDGQILFRKRVANNRSEFLENIDSYKDSIKIAVSRFKRRQDFASYCRLVKPDRESNGKRTGNGNNKIGNPFLKCVFMEIINNAVQSSPEIKEYYDNLKKVYKPLKARAIMANKSCSIIFNMLKKQKPFDVEKFKTMTMKNG